MAREVVAEFSDVLNEHYEVEYLDGQKLWVGASGSWDSDSPSVRSVYENVDAARLAARFVSKWSGYDTRVVKVTE